MTRLRLYILTFGFMALWISRASGQWTIPEIQGTGEQSPLVNQTITVDTCQVTVIAQGSFFVRNLSLRSDGDDRSSEALWVHFGASASLVPGDLVTMAGRVAEDGNGNTVLIATSVDPVGHIPLASPITIDTLHRLKDRSRYGYEFIEGQWVVLDSAFLLSSVENGGDLIVNPLRNRSFREPGIEYPAFLAGIPQFDGNPEKLLVDPNRFLSPPERSMPAGTRISGVGVIVQRGNSYAFWPTSVQYFEQPTYTSLDADTDFSLTVASWNIRQFGQGDPDYNTRLLKLARYIKDVAGYPDILAFQEIQSEAVLADLVKTIGQLEGGYNYEYFFEPANGFSTIHSAYIYKPCFSDVRFQRLGIFEKMSSGETLHDRPPVLMQFAHPASPGQELYILNLHMRSLNGLFGSNSSFVRRKRHEQAQSVARMIQEIGLDQTIIVLGDYNAYSFTDGIVDVFAQISGKKSLGASYETVPILIDSMDAPLLELPESEQYSYVFEDNSQLIDHILTRNTGIFSGESYHMLRGNADAPETWLADPLKEWRITDHDGLLARFELPIAQVCESPVEPIDDFQVKVASPQQEGVILFTAEIPDPGTLHCTLHAIDGKTILATRFDLTAGRHLLELDRSLVSGIYFLSLKYQGHQKSLRLVIY